MNPIIYGMFIAMGACFGIMLFGFVIMIAVALIDIWRSAK